MGYAVGICLGIHSILLFDLLTIWYNQMTYLQLVFLVGSILLLYALYIF